MSNTHSEITDRILAELRAGAAPWVKPWENRRDRAPVGIPRNASSGRAYSGVNVFLLWLSTAARPDWSDPAFLTFKQALDAGGNVRKGEKGTPVYFVGEIKRGDDDGDDEGGRAVRFLKRFTVFNVAQCENLNPDRLSAPAAAVVEPFFGGEIGEFYAATGARTVHGGNSAFYAPGPDMIQLPQPDQFATEDSYHATRLHELTHWSGHASRLNRLQPARYGSSAYAAEELVAELGAALLCAHLGVTGELRHAGYIGNWIKLLEDHDRAFVSAAAQASRAVEYLRGQSAATAIAA